MKRCCTCHAVKPLEDFHRRSASPDGRQSRCKACFAHQYRTQGPELREKVRARSEPLRAMKIRLMTAYLSEHPCVDCGEDDIRTLDFDHRDPSDKRAGIAQMLLGGWTWVAVEREMAKCDVRCANCHRVRTAEASGWWKHVAELERREAAGARVAARLAALLPAR